MALVNSAFTVNVTPGAMPPVVHVSEYDVGRTYTVTINGENGSAFNIPTGTTATIEGTLNESVGFTQSATVSNNQVSFTLSESMTAYSGKAWCKIKLTLNNQPVQTCAFVLAVDRAGVEADTVIGAPGFEEQIAAAVDDYLADHEPFFTLPSGGVRNQALLSDGHDGAKWGSQIPAFAEDPNAPASGTEFEPVPIETEVFANRKWIKSGSYTEPDGWYSSNKIAVVPGMTYKVYNNPLYYFLWDENGANGTDMQTAFSEVEYEFTIPEGRYYVGFFRQGATAKPFTMFRTSPTAEEEAALNDPNLKAPNLSLSLANFKADSVVKSVVPLKDAKIVNFGDSIFGNFSYPEDVATYLAEFTGADVYNCGFGGTRLTTHYNENYNLFCFCALVDAIVSGDFSAQEAALASTWQNPTTYPLRLATLKSIDFSKVDIVTIGYGTNDWNGGKEIDNDQNQKDISTYCGAFRYAIEKLLTAYPRIRVYTCTPIFRTQLDENTHEPIQYSDTWTVNGHTLPDFVAALKSVSAEYGIKCIDNYFELGFNKMNRLIYYRENDGTHPSPAGRERIARHIAEEIY